jgi:hypothetical protein
MLPFGCINEMFTSSLQKKKKKNINFTQPLLDSRSNKFMGI